MAFFAANVTISYAVEDPIVFLPSVFRERAGKRVTVMYYFVVVSRSP